MNVMQLEDVVGATKKNDSAADVAELLIAPVVVAAEHE